MAQKIKQKVYSALEVAKICGVVNQTVINWIRANHLKASVTPGGQFRVYPEDLRDFLVSKQMRVPLELSELLKKTEKVLVVVEDDRVLNDLLSVQFRRAFPSVNLKQAFDGFEAGSLLVTHRPQAVLLDLNLPGVDGYEICRRVKSDPDYRNPFVVVMTAGDDPDAQVRCTEAGADAFFLKPVSAEALIKILRDHFLW
jgi:excisionase family DNA binding protein